MEDRKCTICSRMKSELGQGERILTYKGLDYCETCLVEIKKFDSFQESSESEKLVSIYQSITTTEKNIAKSEQHLHTIKVVIIISAVFTLIAVIIQSCQVISF